MMNSKKRGRLNTSTAAFPDRPLLEAYQHFQKGRLQAAEAICREVLSKQPMHADANIMMGHINVHSGRYKLAITSIQRALRSEPDNAKAHFFLGLAFYKLGRTYDAIPRYEHALQLMPSNTNARLNLAIAQMEIGRLEDAAGNFRMILKDKPDTALAHYHLTRIRNYETTLDDISAMKSIYNRPTTKMADRIYLAFSLGSTLEKHGEYDEAFDYFEAGHSLKKTQSPPFRLDEQKHLFYEIMNTFDEEHISRNSPAGIGDDMPIFIFGMPRSGTTLAEQILSSHPLVSGAGELSHFEILQQAIEKTGKSSLTYWSSMNEQEIHNLGIDYLEKLKTHSEGSVYVTDTTPMNFIHIGLIATALPSARLIHCCRDSMDTCLSIFQQLLSDSHNYAHNLTDLGNYYRLYEEMMKHWNRILPDRIYELNYEDLVTDNEANIRKLLDYCNLPFHEDCLAFHKNRRMVRTPSDNQVRQPIYKSSIGRWKYYEARLLPLKTILQ